MITSKENLKQYLEQDRVALHIERKKPRIIGDEIWKFQIALRKYEYYLNVSGGMLHKLKMILAYLRYHRLAVALGLFEWLVLTLRTKSLWVSFLLVCISVWVLLRQS